MKKDSKKLDGRIRIRSFTQLKELLSDYEGDYLLISPRQYQEYIALFPVTGSKSTARASFHGIAFFVDLPMAGRHFLEKDSKGNPTGRLLERR